MKRNGVKFTFPEMPGQIFVKAPAAISQTDVARNIPLKTGDTGPHISGIAPLLQKGSKYPDKRSYTGYSPSGCKKAFQLAHFSILPF
jgi:hypothetical protein